MKRLILIICCVWGILDGWAQQKNDYIDLNQMMERRRSRDEIESGSLMNLQFYRYKDPIINNGEVEWVYLMPELPVYPPLKFKSEKQRQQWNRLVANVKRVLPIAKQVRGIIAETTMMLEQLPDKKSKDAHIRNVERDIKRQFTPQMKQLTYSQGKLLIKLVDRECNQSSYEIVKAFIGPGRAAFYQVFAWTFGASLKKEYRPEDDDRLVERIAWQIETGQIQ